MSLAEFWRRVRLIENTWRGRGRWGRDSGSLARGADFDCLDATMDVTAGSSEGGAVWPSIVWGSIAGAGSGPRENIFDPSNGPTFPRTVTPSGVTAAPAPTFPPNAVPAARVPSG